MRATLWEGTGETGALRRAILTDVFAAAGIPLEVVATQEALLAAAAHARRASDRDILLIDCARGEPSDVERCVAVATRTTLALHIIHPHEETVHDIEGAAGRPLVWLPANFSADVLLAKLHALQAERAVAPASTERPVLSPREREVAELIAAGRTNGEIAAQLHIGGATVKTHVRHVMRKLGVATRRDVITHYRAARDESPG